MTPQQVERQFAPEETPVNTSETAEWLAPVSLTANVESAPYPSDALPEKIRAAVMEVQQFTKAPIALVASSALGALSVASQAYADVQRVEKLAGPISIYTLTIADSGERKSTCDDFFASPIREYQEQQAEAAKPEIKKFRAEAAAWEAKHAGIKDKIRQLAKDGKATGELERALRENEKGRPREPRVPRLLRGDDTPESLAWHLMHEWPAAGVLSSEAALILGAHGMGQESIMRNLGLLNILWDGGSLAIGRRTSESFTLRGAKLTIALQVQETTLRTFLNRTNGLARGMGFLARFLVAWPQSTQGYRPFTEPPNTWPALAEYKWRIADILNNPVPVDEDGVLHPPLMCLDPEAKADWITFHDAIEAELVAGGELYNVRDVASKSADNATRLAALFQICEHGLGGAVSKEAFEGASRIAAWHLNESRRFLGEIALAPELADAAQLDRWLIEYCRREFNNTVPTTVVLQFGPSQLRQADKLESAMSILEGLSRARLAKAGRRKFVVVNPALTNQRRDP